jgi:hypothetical protein
MRHYVIAAALFISNSAAAHELTPTYPEFKPSYVDNVSVTTIKLWNRREDVNYYELSVHDEDWKPIPFASTSNLIKIDYLESKIFEVFIRDADLEKVEFICTTSKLLKDDVLSTGITSRICSRVK